jgi:hypothetical protein
MSITKILQGIDRYESAYTDGWWETSSGAEFGRLKLVEAQGYEYGLLGRITELEAQLAAAQADAARYLRLRRDAVELSLSNDTIAMLLKDQTELDAAIAGEATRPTSTT